MKLTFTDAIGKVFNNPEYQVSVDQLTKMTLPESGIREIDIYNLQQVFSRLVNALNSTNERVETGTIELPELIRLKKEFYEAKAKLLQLEQKEQQDVEDLKNSTRWHERSKLIRVFVSSEAGEQLDEEKLEAEEARSAAQQFSNDLEDLESVINYHIMDIGERRSPAFKKTVNLWRTIGKLRDDAQATKNKIGNAYSYLSGGGSCRSCGYPVGRSTEASADYLRSADRQINNQLGTLTPWYEQLTAEVETTIDKVRASLLIPVP